MPYALKFANTAAEDLARLVDSLPLRRRARAVDAIEAACRSFAQHPIRRSAGRDPPHFPLHLVIDEVHYNWVATYHLTEDESTVVITHAFRVPL